MTTDAKHAPTFWMPAESVVDAPAADSEAPRTDSLQDLLRLLGSTPVSAGDDLPDLPDLPLATLRVRADAALLHEGAPSPMLYVVQSGSFKGLRTLEDGYEQVLSIAQPGELLGCEALHGGLRRCSVVALEDATVYALPAAELRALARRSPAFTEALRHGLSRQLARTAEVADILSAVASDARLSRFILWLAARAPLPCGAPSRLQLRMSRRDIASLLGLAHETVSRSFTLLSEEGCLRVHNRDIEILDLQALRERARNTRGSLAEPTAQRNPARAAARPAMSVTWWGSPVSAVAA